MSDIESASLIIRLGVGIVMVSFGAYQMLKPGDWLQYIPKLIRFIMPLRPETIMRMHSLGNMTLGMLLLSGLLQPLSLWLVLAWWVFILPLCARVDITVGLRDLAIIMSILALILLQ